MKLTENFDINEFACKDGTAVPDKYIQNVQKLADNLQVLREYIAKPIRINSGYRSIRHNTDVGGKPNSMHLEAKAADIVVAGITPKKLKTIIEQLIAEGRMHDGGIGLYKTFVHYDIGKSRRWFGS